MRAFEITREDGRSNAQVVLDYVRGGEPGRLYTYQELGEALSVGTDRAYTERDVRAVVTQVYPRLLKEQQRALHNVRGQGYRLALAGEHQGLALARKRRADVQMLRGVQTLQHVRWEELDPEARKAHEGSLMVLGGMYAQQQAFDRRLRRIEAAIAEARPVTAV